MTTTQPPIASLRSTSVGRRRRTRNSSDSTRLSSSNDENNGSWENVTSLKNAERISDDSTSTRVNLIVRALGLFFIGALLAFVLNVLQMEYRVTNLLAFFQLNWWVLPVCGLAASKVFSASC